MVNKKDFICGMQGHIQKHGHYFCSDECVRKYEKQKGIKPKFELTSSKLVIYALVGLLIIELALGALGFEKHMATFMGVFFIAVSLLKMADWPGFTLAFSSYDIVAKRIMAYGFIYPLIEFSLGVLYLLKTNLQVAALVTFIVMLVGSIGVIQNLLSKNPVKCACLGTFFNIPLTKFTLFEDLAMIGMALVLLI